MEDKGGILVPDLGSTTILPLQAISIKFVNK